MGPLFPYYSHKNPLKYGNGMGSLWEGGPIYQGSLEKIINLMVFTTRWAPTSYKWSYKPCKWPYKWVTGVITPFITSRGPTLKGNNLFTGVFFKVGVGG